MRTVIIVGNTPYTETLQKDEEIWAMNKIFTVQENISRLYIMDDFDCLPKGTEEILANVSYPIFLKTRNPKIRTSVPYPLLHIARVFGLMGKDDTIYDLEKSRNFNSTCSLSYLLAQAAYEKVGKIIIHQMMLRRWSLEYMIQKESNDYWIGFCRGKGIEVVLPDNSFLCKPNSWCSSLYGYVNSENMPAVSGILTNYNRRLNAISAKFSWSKEFALTL